MLTHSQGNDKNRAAVENNQEISISDQTENTQSAAKKKRTKTNLERRLDKRYRAIQELTDRASDRSSEMIGYLENRDLDQNKKIMGVPSSSLKAFSRGGAFAMAASLNGELEFLENGEALLKLASGIVSKKICEQACTRKGCQTPRLRALCQAKCGQNKKAQLRCS